MEKKQSCYFLIIVVLVSFSLLFKNIPQIRAEDSPIFGVSGNINGTSHLYKIDTSFANDVLIGTIRTLAGDTPTITDIALDIDDTLYGVSFSRLYQINSKTAIATEIGANGFSNVNALTFDNQGKLYAVTGGGNLLTIDKDNGTSTFIGNFGSGFSSSGDLVFHDNKLYATVSTASNVDDVLVTVDYITGAATPVDVSNGIGFKNVYGLFISNGKLFGLTYAASGATNGSLIEIDLVSGKGLFVREIPFNAFGAASFPSPVPTAVDLISFEASDRSNGFVALEWVTAIEIDNYGFNLYRSKTYEGPYQQINDSLIPRSFDYNFTYSYIDGPVSSGFYYYLLEDVDIYGVPTQHGPIEIQVDTSYANNLNSVFLPIIINYVPEK
ncbi:MAG: hypothetical protein DWQ04_13320 [Chloroflexi bacterium]|nr:MAG: hypothetical protein DWQ04_13320 [Chloroflexota bacterium]